MPPCALLFDLDVKVSHGYWNGPWGEKEKAQNRKKQRKHGGEKDREKQRTEIAKDGGRHNSEGRGRDETKREQDKVTERNWQRTRDCTKE